MYSLAFHADGRGIDQLAYGMRIHLRDRLSRDQCTMLTMGAQRQFINEICRPLSRVNSPSPACHLAGSCCELSPCHSSVQMTENCRPHGHRSGVNPMQLVVVVSEVGLGRYPALGSLRRQPARFLESAFGTQRTIDDSVLALARPAQLLVFSRSRWHR